MIGFSCFGITWFSRWSSYRITFTPRVAPAPFDEHAWMREQGYASGQQAPYGQGVQMAQSVDAPQYDDTTATAAGEALNVPPYQAALAAYESPVDMYADPVKPIDDTASVADGVTAGPTANFSTDERPICESCETQPVAIACVECEESLCTNCDATLHRSQDKARHNRTHL